MMLSRPTSLKCNFVAFIRSSLNSKVSNLPVGYIHLAKPKESEPEPGKVRKIEKKIQQPSNLFQIQVRACLGIVLDENKSERCP